MSSPLQEPPPPQAAGPGLPPPITYSVPMLLPVLVLVFFLICFFSIFLLRDLLFYLSSRSRDGQAGGGTQQDGGQGLDPTIISSFPTLPYSSVRRIQEGKCGAECAVCLAEFGTGDVIRLLTVCCHAFHPGCIDSWLASHTTCPTCRSDLQAPPDEAAVLAVREAVEEVSGAHSRVISVVDELGSGVHSHVISVVDEEEEEPKLMTRDGNVVRTTGTAEENIP